MLAKSLKIAGAGHRQNKLYVDDVFSAYTYTGNGSTQTITNGIDLAGEGGLVWIKQRGASYYHTLWDTNRGVSKWLSSQIAGGTSDNPPYGLTAFNSDGFSLSDVAGGDYGVNGSGASWGGAYISWTFRKAAKFFDVVTFTAATSASTVVSHSLGITPGMVILKRTDSTGDWRTWHKDLTSGYSLDLQTTAAQSNRFETWLSATSSSITISDSTLADGGQYVAYLFAHDTDADGIIQCGSYVGNGSTTGPSIDLGWEPQYVLIKRSTGGTGNWIILDSARGMPVGSNDASLVANSSGAENGVVIGNWISPTATGFQITDNSPEVNGSASDTYIYLAIRRPNKPPTSGTQVYNAIARTGTGAAATVTGVGFAPDLVIAKCRNVAGFSHTWFDRLRGAARYLLSQTTDAETTDAASLTSFNMDGVSVGTDNVYGGINYSASANTYINHFVRRAPGVFETFCDTGTGANKTEAHGLAAIPELWLRKGRSGATQWVWGSSLIANTKKIVMPSPNGVVTDATAWNSTYPTATQFSVGTASAVNTPSATYVTYLWASKPGISKVFTYTGDGGSGKVINCGFAAGARFILIIRTTASTTQDVFIWDSTRGIIAGNDPHLSLNTTTTEVTTDDSVDPDNSGFAVNQVAATNINVNGAVYIGVAYA